jgi:putative ABC transport system permease protein
VKGQAPRLGGLWPNLRRLESAVSVVSIAVGVYLVVTLLHLASGLEASLARQLENVGSRTLYVTKFEQGLRLGQRTAEERRRPDLEVRHAEALRARCTFLRAVSPELSVATGVRTGGRSLPHVNVIGGTEDYLLAHNAVPARGRFLTAGEVRSRRPVCVIGDSVARSLFGGRDPVGSWLEVEGRRLEIVGIAGRRGSPVFGGGVDRFVLLPLGLFESLGVPRRFSDFVIAVQPAPALDLSAAAARLRQEMRHVRRLRPGELDNFAVTPQSKLLDLYRNGTRAVVAGLGAVGGISLLVGAVGILTVMTLTVAERKVEIGLRRAVGARRVDIFAVFLLEAGMITALGGAVGGVASVVSLAVFGLLTGIQLGVSWVALALGLGVSGLTGLLSGVLPALRAARLAPALALQYE